MSDMCSSFAQSHCEPNWRYANRVSFVQQGQYGLVACMDHYARKAMEAQEDWNDYLYCIGFMDDWDNAFSEGYLLHVPGCDAPMDESERHPDPDYGLDPVYLGPYYVDQKDMGYFIFHGPRAFFAGPGLSGRSRGGYFLYP